MTGKSGELFEHAFLLDGLQAHAVVPDLQSHGIAAASRGNQDAAVRRADDRIGHQAMKQFTQQGRIAMEGEATSAPMHIDTEAAGVLVDGRPLAHEKVRCNEIDGVGFHSAGIEARHGKQAVEKFVEPRKARTHLAEHRALPQVLARLHAGDEQGQGLKRLAEVVAYLLDEACVPGNILQPLTQGIGHGHVVAPPQVDQFVEQRIDGGEFTPAIATGRGSSLARMEKGIDTIAHAFDRLDDIAFQRPPREQEHSKHAAAKQQRHEGSRGAALVQGRRIGNRFEFTQRRIEADA
jgi:hypothetical protein